MMEQQRFRIDITELDVRNFGAIKSADIEFAEFTFLVGPQNTGKTYIATLAAMLAKQVSPALVSAVVSRVSTFLREKEMSGSISYETLNSSFKMDDIEKFVLKDAFFQANFFEQLFHQYYLVSETRELIRRGEKEATIKAYFKVNGRSFCTLAIQITIDSLSTKLDFEQGAIGFLLESIKPEFYFFPEGMGSRIRYGTSPRQVTHYVPAERFMVIPIFAQVINLLLSVYRGLVQPGTLELQTPTQFSMKQLLFDYLSDLNGALNTPGTYKVIDMGSIIVGNRQISFQDSIHDAKFPIYSAGSGLAQLSGIIIPLARLNPDFLIVEEPEVNLHPDAQLKVAEYLGEVSTSRRILITTHSHYLIAKLAILYSKGVIRTLSGYYIDLASGVTRKLEMNRENASVELPQSIESAMESLASEAMKLEHNFTTREN